MQPEDFLVRFFNLCVLVAGYQATPSPGIAPKETIMNTIWKRSRVGICVGFCAMYCVSDDAVRHFSAGPDSLWFDGRNHHRSVGSSNSRGHPLHITNIGTAEKRSAVTEAVGSYRFVNLVPGRYRVDVEKTGFKHFTRETSWWKWERPSASMFPCKSASSPKSLKSLPQTPLLQTESGTLEPGG